MAKLKVMHKWVGLGRNQSFMLLLGQVGTGWVTLLGRVGSGQENWTHVQLWVNHCYPQQEGHSLECIYLRRLSK